MPTVSSLVMTKQIEETVQHRVVIGAQPASVIRHQAWTLVVGHFAIDHAGVSRAGIRLVQQSDVWLDTDKAKRELAADVVPMNRRDIA